VNEKREWMREIKRNIKDYQLNYCKSNLMNPNNRNGNNNTNDGLAKLVCI
jgi:hypothetical protein